MPEPPNPTIACAASNAVAKHVTATTPASRRDLGTPTPAPRGLDSLFSTTYSSARHPEASSAPISLRQPRSPIRSASLTGVQRDYEHPLRVRYGECVRKASSSTPTTCSISTSSSPSSGARRSARGSSSKTPASTSSSRTPTSTSAPPRASMTSSSSSHASRASARPRSPASSTSARRRAARRGAARSRLRQLDRLAQDRAARLGPRRAAPVREHRRRACRQHLFLTARATRG